MTYGRQAVDDLLTEGMASIEAAFNMAKAAGPEDGDKDGDLDADFKAFDQAQQGSEQAEDQRQEGEDEDDVEDEGGDADGDEGDSDFNGGKQGQPAMAKAESVVTIDAGPILQQIDQTLAALNTRLGLLETQNATLAKAVQESARGNATMAKAVAAAMNIPLTPKSQGRVQVPVAQPKPGALNRSEVMSKAMNGLESGRLSVEDISTFEVMTNQYGIEAALSQMPAVRAVVTAKD